MAKHDAAGRDVEWFGADVEEDEERKETAVYLDGFKGVDADVPRQVRQPDGTVAEVMVRRPAPTIVQAKTTAGERVSHDVARLTARYKTMREAARFAPADDREAWETRREIAFAEMQIARMRARLDRYTAAHADAMERAPKSLSDFSPFGKFGRVVPGEPPEHQVYRQVVAYRDYIAHWRGQFMELTGQG